MSHEIGYKYTAKHNSDGVICMTISKLLRLLKPMAVGSHTK